MSRFTTRSVPWAAIAFAAALLIPILGTRFYTSVATDVLILGLFATSLNLLLGTTGLVSFGHAAYFAVGAYVCAIAMKTFGCRSRWPCRWPGSPRPLRRWSSASSAFG